MRRNTLILVTGVLLIGGLFGLTAAVSAADTVEPDAAPNLSLNFSDQESADGNVTVENVSSDGVNATVIITYQNGSNLTIAGTESGNYTDETVNVALSDLGGFPGNHTAHIVETSNISAQTNTSANVSSVTAGEVKMSETANVTAPPNLSLNFSDQEPMNGAVTVENVSSDGVNATVVITYQNGGNLTIVGTANGTYADETVQVTLDSTAGFPGNHTAHIIETADISSTTMNTGNVSSATASAVQESQQAYVSVDVGNDGSLARPTLGNDLLTDVNGDMSFDILDVQALFMNLGTTELSNFAQYFDFAGTSDGEVDIFDVQALYGWYANPPAP